MLSTYLLKSRFQAILRPVAKWLHGSGVTANQITIGTCLISLLLGSMAIWLCCSKYLFLLISFWCLIRMACNALDGMLAREYGQASHLGAVLNEAGDIVSDIALYLPFAWVAGSHTAWVVAIVVLSASMEVLSWACARDNRPRANHGPMGKSDRALVFGVTALLIGCGINVADWVTWLWWVVTALLIITFYNRLRYLAAKK